MVSKIEIHKYNEILASKTLMNVDFDLPVSPEARTSGNSYVHELKVSLDVPGLDPSKTKTIRIH